MSTEGAPVFTFSLPGRRLASLPPVSYATGSQGHNSFATVREMKRILHNTVVTNDKIAVYRECCFPNCTNLW